MNFSSQFALLTASVLTAKWNVSCTDVDAEPFVMVVSDADVAESVYPRNKQRMQENSPRDTDSDVKMICRGIYAGYKINRQTEKENSIFLTNPLDEANHPTKRIKTFPTLVDSALYDDEEVFACSLLDDSHYIRRLYVSKQYNLNADGEIDPSKKYVAGRFIFRKFPELRLYGLVELPGENFLSPEHNVERLYLERREETDLAWKMGYDGLCKQDKRDRHRICTAVFASKYFEEKIIFSGTASVSVLKGAECGLEVVSFQTNYASKAAAKRLYREWMLSCKFDKGDVDVPVDYLLSHAYESNQIFVYSRDARTRAVFPENLTTDVRIRVEPRRRSDGVPNDAVFLDDHDI